MSDRDDIAELIKKFGNKNSCYCPFYGAISYPFRSMDFIRTGFMKIAPTLSARDYKDPKYVIVRKKMREQKLIYANYRKIDNMSPKIARTLLARDSKGFGSGHETSNAVLVKQATKSGYVECSLPGIVDTSYPESTTRRGRVQENGKICPTLTTDPEGLKLIREDYRIRKLTPTECARLMSFTDEDAAAMLSVNSNGQCYKQCGNSIVTKVLEYLFKSIM